MPRRRKSGFSSLSMLGLALTLFGFTLLGVGLFAPAQASTILAFASNILLPKAEVEFVSSTTGSALGMVSAYDYSRDITYSTMNGRLSLPEGSYIVYSPGFVPVALYLYGVAGPARVELEPVEDIVAEIAVNNLERMSMLDLSSLIIRPYLLATLSFEDIYARYADSRLGAYCGNYAMLDYRQTPEGITYATCRGGAVYVVKVGLVVYPIPGDRFDEVRREVAARIAQKEAEEQAKIRGLQQAYQLYKVKNFTVRYYEGVQASVTGDVFDYPTSSIYKIFVRTEAQITGASPEFHAFLKTRMQKTDGKWTDVKFDYGVFSQTFTWPSWTQSDAYTYKNSLIGAVIAGAPVPEVSFGFRAGLPPNYVLQKVETPGSGVSPAMARENPGYDALFRLRWSTARSYVLTVYAWPADKMSKSDFENLLVNNCQITGKVVDATKSDNPPLPGAVVTFVIKRNVGDTTWREQVTLLTKKADENGEFSVTLRLPKSDKDYPFTVKVGHNRFEIKINGKTCQVVGASGGNGKVLSTSPLTLGVTIPIETNLPPFPSRNTPVVGDFKYDPSTGQSNAEWYQQKVNEIIGQPVNIESAPRVEVREVQTVGGEVRPIVVGEPTTESLSGTGVTLQDTQPRGSIAQPLTYAGVGSIVAGVPMTVLGMRSMGKRRR